MRDFRLQAFINWSRLFFKNRLPKTWLLEYAYFWFLPFKYYTSKNIFCRGDLSFLKTFILPLGKFSSNWFQRIFEPETFGVRVWEYGKLFEFLKTQKFNLKNLKILDLGCGASLLPNYLASLGANVIALDLKTPQEKRVKKDENIKFVSGDMVHLPFKANSFDLAICISAIEHLDTQENNLSYFSKKDYWQRVKKALNEIKKVTKKNGYFFITTDFYLPIQKSDNWAYSQDSIHGAFDWAKLYYFKKLLNLSNFSTKNLKTKLLSSTHFSNYRGRYFTTIALMGQVS